MKKKIPFRHSGEHGQAMMEVAAAAVAIIFVVIGFFTLASVGIVSIKSLLLTRFEAEKEASSATNGGSASSGEIVYWNYTTLKQGKTGEEDTVIPFLAGDQPQMTASEARTDFMDNPAWSSADDRNYTFLPYRNTPGIAIQNLVYNGNSLAVSMLHRKAPVLPAGMSGSGAFQTRFKDGWLDTEKIDITDWPSSEIFFPAFGPRR